MGNDERRDETGRREAKDRRLNSSSMISNYANHGGAERRTSSERRKASDRRAVA